MYALPALTSENLGKNAVEYGFTVAHYSPEMDSALIPQSIEDLPLNKLNRIKKISLEAFFYFLEIEKMAEA